MPDSFDPETIRIRLACEALNSPIRGCGPAGLRPGTIVKARREWQA